MMRLAALLVVAILMPFGAFAASDEFVWSEPGVDPFKGDIEKAIERFAGIPPAAKAKLVTKIKKSMVMADALKNHISASSMTKEEKEKALKLAKDQPFFNVEQLSKLELPQALLAEIVAKEIDASGYTVGEIAPGQKCDWMAFGRDKVVPRVVYEPAAKIREPNLKAHFFTEEEARVKYTVAQPLVCDNLCFWKVEVGLVKTFKAPAPAEAVPVRVESDHTIRIRVWDGSSWIGVKRLAAVHGLQSRDLGGELRNAARKGELKPYAGCHRFVVEFRDVAYERARGTVVRINGKPSMIPREFSPQANAFEIMVCDGEGTLTLPTNWIHGDTVLVIHSPWRRPELHYPPSGRLVTCTGQQIADGQCGTSFKGVGFGEFFRLPRESTSNYHFVK
ncbi:MAG: hypothetical protein HYT40_02395 [Candidatus Sungbacteria bacterium]|uniref:Uncharacterized protein n=1 Tax=Candidatus Sungiibacteriota bacterium TaxID=2750080 RepID=A0A931SBP3_9BACT|nr:hypothetical protein [Candidatus Sungbacteria bacterium]